jgi:hypothetical protein
MQNFTFFEAPKYFFSFFYSLLLIYSIGKNRCGPLSSQSAQLGADPVPYTRVKPAHAICFLGTLPSGPRCLVDPTYQPHFFAGGKPLRTRPATVPVTAQIHPLPLLRHRRSSTAKFRSMGQSPVTTLHHKDAHVCVCRPEPSRQLRCVVVSRHRCPPASSLVIAASVGFWSRPLGDEVLEQAAPLAKLPLPKACRGDHRLALPARSQGALAPPVVLRGSPRLRCSVHLTTSSS